MKEQIIVRARQVYRAKAKRGFRYVRVERVSKQNKTALLIEVDEEGNNRRGRMRDGFLASMKWNTDLTFRDGRWVMPSYYTLVKD